MEGEWLCLWGREGELEFDDLEWEGKGEHEVFPPLELPFGTLKAALSDAPFVTKTSLRQSLDDFE